MIKAVKDIDGMGVNKAAELHSIPKTTLKDRISGRVAHGSKPGRKSYLTSEEETQLAEYLLEVSEAGYGKTHKQVKAMVEGIAKEKGVMNGDKTVSDGWWRRFLQRNPQLTLRKGDSTAAVRLACTSAETLRNYFGLLREVLYENDLMDKPAQLYNVDETGMPLEHSAPNVIAKKGVKKVRYRSTGNKAQITVVGCVNAVGNAIPPMVIYAAKSFNAYWCMCDIPGTGYALSPKGRSFLSTAYLLINFC